MLIGHRLKEIREAKNLTQGDIESATGLLRAYVSRVENGHTIPGVETLEKWARALDMPLYLILRDEEGDQPPAASPKNEEPIWGKSGKEAAALARLRGNLANMTPERRKLLMQFSEYLSGTRTGKKAALLAEVAD
jgi:transcriptional regulator with XRE-family HTH domain